MPVDGSTPTTVTVGSAAEDAQCELAGPCADIEDPCAFGHLRRSEIDQFRDGRREDGAQ